MATSPAAICIEGSDPELRITEYELLIGGGGGKLGFWSFVQPGGVGGFEGVGAFWAFHAVLGMSKLPVGSPTGLAFATFNPEYSFHSPFLRVDACHYFVRDLKAFREGIVHRASGVDHHLLVAGGSIE